MFTRLLSTFSLFVLFSSSILAQGGGGECIRLVSVDPQNDLITIHNRTLATIDISDYRLCSLFSYGDISAQPALFGDPSAIPPDDFLVLFWNLDDIDSDMALYLPTGAFSDPGSMVDFMQYGAAGNGRESEAAEAGLWVAGTFVEGSDPAGFTGNCGQHGVEYWFSATSVEEFDQEQVTLSPNPFQDRIELRMNMPVQGDIMFRVMNITGEVIFEEQMGKGMQLNYTLDSSLWSSGIYFFQMSLDDQVVLTRKLAKF
ncbi:MAG: T9SS type A sorting domain-containing protein [Flavobacteriales bacterium]|nr:T9SS type A sorting domain-containing protein [Flavobacteriales bacterium]